MNMSYPKSLSVLHLQIFLGEKTKSHGQDLDTEHFYFLDLLPQSFARAFQKPRKVEIKG